MELYTLIAAIIAAIAAVVAAVITAIASFWNTSTQKKIAKQQIDADVKSKTRIDWIQNVRKEAANFTTNCILFEEYSSKMKLKAPAVESVKPTEDGVKVGVGQASYSRVPSDYADVASKEDLEKVRRDLIRSGKGLVLYFGPDTSGENQEVVTYVNSILDIVKERKNNYKISDVKDNSTKLEEYLRKYLKNEWSKAKLGN